MRTVVCLLLALLMVTAGYETAVATASKKQASQTIPVIRQLTLRQGEIVSFSLLRYFPGNIIKYETQVLNNEHNVVTAKILNDVIYILVSPYDFHYIGVKIPDDYRVKVVATKADQSTITKQIKIKVLQENY